LVFDLSVLYKFQLPIPCVSYFGYEQNIPVGSYPDDFMNKALNTPIQTFTSHVVNETVFGVLEKFWELGYTKEDINVYYVRHDEPLFLFTGRIIKDAWIFKDCSEIYIPGFTPIHLDFHFGQCYQEEDERITSEIQKSIASSNHQYTVYDDKDFEEEAKRVYKPYPSVEHVYVQFFESNQQNMHSLIFYNYRTKERRKFIVMKSNFEDELIEVINRDVLNWVGYPKYLLVQNSGMDFMDSIGPDDETLMKVFDSYDSNVALARGDS